MARPRVTQAPLPPNTSQRCGCGWLRPEPGAECPTCLLRSQRFMPFSTPRAHCGRCGHQFSGNGYKNLTGTVTLCAYCGR